MGEEVEMKTERSESTPSPSLIGSESGKNPSPHDTIEVITVDENTPSTKNTTRLPEKEDSEIVVEGSEEHVEEEEANVVGVNGDLEEKAPDEDLTGDGAAQQVHVVEVHSNCSPSSDNSNQQQNPDVNPTDATLLLPVSPGSTKTPPNTPHRQDSVVEDREQQQGSNMLGVLSAEGYQTVASNMMGELGLD